MARRNTLLAYGFYWLVSLQVGYEHGRTLYFATFYAWLNAANLALLAFGTPRLIRRFGVGFALCFLPLAAAAGAAALAIHAVVSVMYALRIGVASVRSALYEPALSGVLVAIPAGETGPTRLLRACSRASARLSVRWWRSCSRWRQSSACARSRWSSSRSWRPGRRPWPRCVGLPSPSRH